MTDERRPDPDPDAFPTDGDLETKATFLLQYAVLAPSSHNSQPWAFTVRDGVVDVHADESRWLRVADPAKRELYLSVGCALENLLVAADHFGLDQDVAYLPADDDTVAARVTLRPSDRPSPSRDADLFDALTRRHTSHQVFEDRPLPDALLDRFAAAAGEAVPDLRLVTDAETRRRVAELQTRADERQFDDPDYREELGYWIGTGALGASWLKARVGQLVVTHLDIGEREGQKNSRLVESAPVLAVVVTAEDGREQQLRAGQLFERLALLATAESVAVHPMSQTLEVPELAAELHEALDLGAVTPQHLFRLGYADPVESPTPRRPVEAVRR
jgi:nitroreductase